MRDNDDSVKVKVSKVGFADPNGLQGVVVLTADDGRNFPISAFSGEVAQHIGRFIDGDRTSRRALDKLVWSKRKYEGIHIETLRKDVERILSSERIVVFRIVYN